MSRRQNPEDFPPQTGGELPDLSVRDAGDQYSESQPDEKADQQSIFSKRSGIQDPLVRTEPRGETKTDEKAEAPENAVATQEQDTVEQNPAEQDHPEAHPAERKGRSGKPRRRLVKSKRHLERARRRQKNYLQERRDKKRLRVFFQRVKLVLKLCFVVLWLVLLWEVVHSPLWVLDQPRFSVSNARLIQSSQLSPWIKAQVGKPIYAIDTGKLARKLQKNFDMAKLVVVRRQILPTRLEIMIQEKQPWAEIYAIDPNPPVETKSTSQSQADKTESLPQPKPTRPAIQPYGLVVPTGIIFLAPYHYHPGLFGQAGLDKLIVTPGTVFSLNFLDRLHELIWQAQQIQGLHLQSVDVRNPNRIVFNYQELPVVLGRMNSTAAERLARLIPLIPKIKEYRDGMQSVDLQWEEQVTFHQKPNAKLDLPKGESEQG